MSVGPLLLILEAPTPHVGVASLVPRFPTTQEQHSGAGWPQLLYLYPTGPALPPLGLVTHQALTGDLAPVRTESLRLQTTDVSTKVQGSMVIWAALA